MNRTAVTTFDQPPGSLKVGSVTRQAPDGTMNVSSAGTGTSNAYGRIYQVGSNGRPGKLLYDYGQLGTAGSSLNATGPIPSGLKTGVFLPPGEYFFGLFVVLGSDTPALTTGTPVVSPCTHQFTPASCIIATGGSAVAPDPA